MWAQRTPADAASLKALREMMKAFFSLESALICFEGLGFAYTFLEILRLFQFTV